jgi:outer membrane autotransporter protein
VLFGVDAMHGDNLLMGVALGLDRTDVRTRFNAGEQGVTGMTIAPYIGVLFSDWLTMDATFGYGDAQTDQFRTTAGGARINSDVESSRVFGSVNATATHAIDRLLLSARTGALYATQKDDSFIESNGTVIPESRTNLGRFLLGGELAYAAGNWEPFVGGTYQYDFTRTETVFAPGVAQPRNDDADLLFAVGLRYYGDDGLSGAIEYNKLIGRRNLDEDTISANVRWTF